MTSKKDNFLQGDEVNMKLGNFSVENDEDVYVITYSDSLVPKYNFVEGLNREETEKWVSLLSLAYTFGSSNALQAML